jgi:hypothetical protein
MKSVVEDISNPKIEVWRRTSLRLPILSSYTLSFSFVESTFSVGSRFNTKTVFQADGPDMNRAEDSTQNSMRPETSRLSVKCLLQ